MVGSGGTWFSEDKIECVFFENPQFSQNVGDMQQSFPLRSSPFPPPPPPQNVGDMQQSQFGETQYGHVCSDLKSTILSVFRMLGWCGKYWVCFIARIWRKEALQMPSATLWRQKSPTPQKAVYRFSVIGCAMCYFSFSPPILNQVFHIAEARV